MQYCKRACMHECLTLLHIFQTDPDAQTFLSAYSLLCGSGAACTTATAAIVADTSCDTDTDDPSVICTGTCRSLIDNFLNACPANVSF